MTMNDTWGYKSYDDNLGYWIDPADWAEWNFEIKSPGKFLVTAEIASQGNCGFVVRSGETFVKGTAPNTGSYTRFTMVKLGAIKLPAGRTSLSVRPVTEGWQPMNLKAIRLTPVK